jgi:hypothetical protein
MWHPIIYRIGFSIEPSKINYPNIDIQKNMCNPNKNEKNNNYVGGYL